MKLPEAISVAVTPMALPVRVPGFEMCAGRTQSKTVGTAGDVLKQTLRPIHGSRFGRPDGLRDKRKINTP